MKKLTKIVSVGLIVFGLSVFTSTMLTSCNNSNQSEETIGEGEEEHPADTQGEHPEGEHEHPEGEHEHEHHEGEEHPNN